MRSSRRAAQLTLVFVLSACSSEKPKGLHIDASFDNPGETVPRDELTFTIRDHPRWEGKQFTDLCSPRLGPKSKLGQIYAALNGGVPVPDGDIDLEAFLGQRVQATIRRKDNGYNQLIAETAMPVDAAGGEAPF